MSNQYEQRPLRLFSISAGPGGFSVSGPADVVPPQIRPGSPCRLESCPKNVDRVCSADPAAGPAGAFPPFRPLCPGRGYDPEVVRSSMSVLEALAQTYEAGAIRSAPTGSGLRFWRVPW